MKNCLPKALALLCLACAFNAARAEYPERPVRIIVPFTPGGATDILARMVAQKLTDAWGQQVVADNRPGANGMLGAELTAKSAPDGHTLLFVAIGHAINPILRKHMPYDTAKDFTPVSLTAILPLMVAVHPSVRARSLQELIALAKTGATPVTYASGGIGSSQHLATELLRYMTQVKLTHVPYKGGNQGLIDVVSGNVDMMVTTILSVTPHIRAGKLRPLAITTARRNSAWPDLPTVAEAGVRGYESHAWYGMVAPAGLPAGVLAKLSTETIRITRSAEVRAALTKQGAEAVGSTPQEFAAFIQAETAKYSKVIREAGIKAE